MVWLMQDVGIIQSMIKCSMKLSKGAQSCTSRLNKRSRDLVRRLHVFFFASRRRHTRFDCDWSSDVCSSDLAVHSAHLREILTEQYARLGLEFWDRTSCILYPTSFNAELAQYDEADYLAVPDRKSVV